MDTGDEFTKTQLEQKKEKTLALIKPDAFLKMGDDFIAHVQPHVCMLCARRLLSVCFRTGWAHHFIRSHICACK